MKSKPSQKIPLGRLEKVDIHTCWSGDREEFTIWLTQAENIEMLAEALDMELEVVSPDQEDAAIVILCHDPINDRQILITHQLETSDSAHLGQALSSMAILQAPTVILLAGEITDEHRSALNWLNQMTLPEFQFFGVELELWRIGKSMAPKFNLVVQPPEWIELPLVEPAEEPEPEPEPEPLTEKQLQNLEFWRGLCHQLERRGSIVKPSDPSTESTMSFAIGRAGFRLYTQINKELNSLTTGLLLSGEDAKPYLYLLEEEREAIEAEIGVALQWDDSGDSKVCYVYCTLDGIDFNDRDRWNDYYQWFCFYLEQFHEVLGDRVKRLNANEYRPRPDYSFNPLQSSATVPSLSPVKQSDLEES
jgi:Domain of unknown function (DUF4268)